MDLDLSIANSTTAIIAPESRPNDLNPASVYLASQAPSGRRTQQQALNVIAGLLSSGNVDCFNLDWSKLRYQHTSAIRAKLSETYKPATANKMLVALRRVLQESWRLGLMSAEDYQRAADLKAVTGETLPAGRSVSTGEILALMNICMSDPNPAGIRDAAIIGIMYSTGLRRDEVVNISLTEIDANTGCIVVTGKRRKQRTVYPNRGSAEALADWLQLRGVEDGPLFLAINKGGNLQFGKKLTSQAIYDMLIRRAEQAGVNEFSPHDLRRSFVSDLLDAGADIATVAKMAGHSNVQTTARYDRRPEQTKQKAAELLHVPYKRRII